MPGMGGMGGMEQMMAQMVSSNIYDYHAFFFIQNPDFISNMYLQFLQGGMGGMGGMGM